MNSPTFRVFWLRENGCDAGVVRPANEIEPAIRERILSLTGGEDGEFILRLPYMDRNEWKQRGKILRSLAYERDGRLIRAILKPEAATRDLVASLALTEPIWIDAPAERHPRFHHAWHRVSLAVQRTLKEAIADVYFSGLDRLKSSDASYSMVVYQSSRPFSAKTRHQFTYDLGDYPDCRQVAVAATTQTGVRMKRILEQLHQRLLDAGRADLARRYTPNWYPDILSAVRRKPRRFLDLLMRETEIVNAVIELGAGRTPLAANTCARAINSILRCVQSVDMRVLGVKVLEAATAALAQTEQGSGADVLDAGAHQRRDLLPSRHPDRGIGREEDRDDRDADRRGQMPDAGIVSDIQARGSEPAREFM